MCTPPQLCFTPHSAQKRKKRSGPVHVQCLNLRYDGSGPERAYVPSNKVPWTRSFPGYLPAMVRNIFTYNFTKVLQIQS